MKMITQKVVEGPQIRVSDVVQFQDLPSNIFVAGNERGNNVPTLLE